MARRVRAGWGLAWLGGAGKSRPGGAGEAGLGTAGLGKARRGRAGVVWQGAAWHGLARPGAARQAIRHGTMFGNFTKFGEIDMHFDMDKDNSLADDVYETMERALSEENAAAAALLGALWLALHGGYTRELAEAIRPEMARHDEDSPSLLREVHP